MAFKKPTINVIKPDIKNLSIYLRSTKKFGKSTLFRNVILEKYGDPSRGLLVGCGNEIGYKMLDSLNVVQITSWKDALDLKKWLIEEKGKEHNIEIVAFDTCDEFVLLADEQTIKESRIENPTKQVKSIKAAFGGYTAGEKYSANNLIKPYMSELQRAGFGIWGIAHTKFKSIKEKGGLEEDGYMQLSSNLGADYESAFGDIFDVVLTGVIDRNVEEKTEDGKTKRYATDEVRKLYFRGTTLIDAGGRFAYGSVPEFMVFDKPNMAHDFVQVVEEGMAKSRLSNVRENIPVSVAETPVAKPSPVPVVESEPVEEIVEPEIQEEDFINPPEEMPEDEYPDNLEEVIRTEFKKCKDADLKAQIKKIISEHGGKLNVVDEDGLKEIYDLLCR